jgi:hypothetical protein
MPASLSKLLPNQSPFTIEYLKRQLCLAFSFALFAVILIFTLPGIGYAWDDDDPLYNRNLSNTPNFNDNYYDRTYNLDRGRNNGDSDDPIYNQNLRNTPTFNDDYYDRTYKLDKSRSDDDY